MFMLSLTQRIFQWPIAGFNIHCYLLDLFLVFDIFFPSDVTSVRNVSVRKPRWTPTTETSISASRATCVRCAGPTLPGVATSRNTGGCTLVNGRIAVTPVGRPLLVAGKVDCWFIFWKWFQWSKSFVLNFEFDQKWKGKYKNNDETSLKKNILKYKNIQKQLVISCHTM